MTTDQLIQAALAELALTTVGYQTWSRTSYADVTRTHWYKAIALLNEAMTGGSSVAIDLLERLGKT